MKLNNNHKRFSWANGTILIPKDALSIQVFEREISIWTKDGRRSDIAIIPELENEINTWLKTLKEKE